jgi:hypothetical protein
MHSSTSSIESLIARTALETAQSGDIDQAKQLAQFLSSDTDEHHEGIQQAISNGFVIGARVYMKWNLERIGTVVKYRTRIGGLYCGIRYPIDVKWDEDGSVFEYDLDSVKLLSAV